MDILSFLQIVTRIAILLFIFSMLLFSYRFFYIIVAFLKDKPLKETKNLGRYAILIPAREESKVIEKLLKSIKMQTYDNNLIDVYVVTERFNDPTTNIATKYGYNFFVRKDLENKRTKGYALNEVIQDIYNKDIKYDAYFIFDADNVLAPNFIEEMNKAYFMGYDVSMAYRNIVNIHDNWVSTCSALLFSNTNTFQNKARSRTTKSIIVSGTGYYISSKIIDKFKGFPFHSLTEDFEISNYLIANNIKTKYVTSTEFYDEQPTTINTINKQRIRWCKGFFNVSKDYRKTLTKSFFKKGSNKLAILDAKFSIIPNICFIVTLLVYLFFLLFGITTGLVFLNFELVEYCLICLARTILFYYIGLDIYTMLLLIAEKDKFYLSKKETLSCLLLNPLFIGLFVYHAIKALFTKKVEWKPIEHTSKEVVIENVEEDLFLDTNEVLELSEMLDENLESNNIKGN